MMSGGDRRAARKFHLWHCVWERGTVPTKNFKELQVSSGGQESIRVNLHEIIRSRFVGYDGCGGALGLSVLDKADRVCVR